jgi:hypothetical protein
MATIQVGNFSKRVLVTGAGWSRNWGGRLAAEMWQTIMDDPAVQISDRLRTLLLAEQSFEVALATTLEPPFEPAERLVLESAIMNSFRSMDRELARVGHGPNIYGVQEFIFRFFGHRSQGFNAGYLFTVNQDLFLERHLYNSHVAGVPGPVLPGIQATPDRPWFSSVIGPYDDSFVVRPVEGVPMGVQLLNQFNVVKLHGSCNWRTRDGRNLLVIGTGKTQLIRQDPLLAWYFDLFKAVLFAGDVRLMVVGYGFSDEHINAVIADAVEKFSLKMFVWSTSADLVEKIRKAPHGERMLKGLLSTASRQMIEVFPRDQSETEEYRRICRGFFG